MGAHHEAEIIPIIGHPLSAIMGAKHETESGPVTRRYSPIFNPAILLYRVKIEIGGVVCTVCSTWSVCSVHSVQYLVSV